jgi:hypothetical protein
MKLINTMAHLKYAFMAGMIGFTVPVVIICFSVMGK